MGDRLVSLLQWFELRARVFQAGPLCRSARFDAADGLGYIHVLRSGGMRVESAGQPAIEVGSPSVLLFMSPTSHRLLPHGTGADTLCASFDFGGGLNNPLVPALRDKVLLDLSELPTLDATLAVLFTEASEQHCGRQAVLDRLVEVVIIQLLRELMDQGRLEFGLLAGLADNRLARAINAMHARPAEPWTLAGLAAEAGMSRARFAAHFRDTVGTTPLAYLADWRLGVAQAMMRRGRSLAMTADAIGYASASAFSRAFSARLGLSPGAWLRQDSARQ